MIDTHAHIDDPQYADQLDAFIRDQQQAGVECIIVPGVNDDSIASVDAVCRQFPGYLLPAAGLHPEEVREDYRLRLDRIRRALMQPSVTPYIAVGEIGLDYHFDTTYRAEQQDAFRIQLQWAAELDLPVIIHSRDATEDTLRIVREQMVNGQMVHDQMVNAQMVHDQMVHGTCPNGKCLGVFHCFSGSYETARQILDLGFCLGIGGVITFKNCRLRDQLVPADGRPAIPLDRLVLETDAPYMAPVPFRGRRNESRWMTYVVDTLAAAYNLPAQTIIDVTSRNARTLFRL
ncbi:MAG: TatD family hydrolase [Paludibacteraceae bacterium]|nr:TatD family hydrolase [Paludibacteraceae bacterium]